MGREGVKEASVASEGQESEDLTSCSGACAYLLLPWPAWETAISTAAALAKPLASACPEPNSRNRGAGCLGNGVSTLQYHAARFGFADTLSSIVRYGTCRNGMSYTTRCSTDARLNLHPYNGQQVERCLLYTSTSAFSTSSSAVQYASNVAKRRTTRSRRLQISSRSPSKGPASRTAVSSSGSASLIARERWW